jgi:hypothetical protein
MTRPTRLAVASLGAIALRPTGNAQGDYYFMSLSTGARISRHQWTILPIPDTAIARVEALALARGPTPYPRPWFRCRMAT